MEVGAIPSFASLKYLFDRVLHLKLMENLKINQLLSY